MAWSDPFARAGRWLLGAIGYRSPRPLSLPAPDFPALPPAGLVGVPPNALDGPLAPAPLIDRYPVVVGAGVTFAYISNVLRLCTSGYRRECVDLARELLERDGATKSLMSNRVLTVAGGRLEIAPVGLEQDDPEHELSVEIARVCDQAVHGITDLVQAKASLAWGIFYGVSSCEIGWTIRNGLILPERLYTIAQRRMGYPEAQSLDLHIWDQGQVRADAAAQMPSNNLAGFGINVGRYPGKFMVHTPSYAGDYPWREGLMRELLWLMAFKNLGLRLGGQFVERFAKVLIWASYTTTDDGKPRAASDDDIGKVDEALAALGAGSLACVTLPDSTAIHMDGPAMKGQGGGQIIERFVEQIDSQVALVIRGNRYTSTPGKSGARAASEVAQQGESENERYDAATLADTFRRDLVSWIVRLNYPGKEHLTPKVAIHLAEPGPDVLLDLATKAAASGVPVDADWLAGEIGLQVTPNTSTTPRRMAPIAPVALPPALLGADVAAASAEIEQRKTEAAAALAASRPANDTNEPPHAAAAE